MLIILAVLGSTGLFTFIQFLITHHDKKKGVLAEIRKDIKELKQFNKDERLDLLRIQLMTLTHIHPENVMEIMEVAEEYFMKHNGNWYMSSLFKEYLEKQGMDVPLWMKDMK